jgi:hypothetical protein
MAQPICIGSLPSETLLQIFTEITEDSVVYISHPLTWHAFSQVCHRWRNLSVKTSSLWTHLHGVPLEFARILLERSGSALISVKYDSSNAQRSGNFDVLSIAMEHLSRIHSMDIFDDEEDVQLLLSRQLRLAAPSLETCLLTLPSHLQAQIQFPLNAPNLKTFNVLAPIRFSGELISTNIRKFCWYGVYTSQGENRHTFDSILEILECMPHLEILTLHNVMDCATVSAAKKPLLQFTSLKLLTVTDHDPLIYPFFKSIQAPSLRSLSVSINGNRSWTAKQLISTLMDFVSPIIQIQKQNHESYAVTIVPSSGSVGVSLLPMSVDKPLLRVRQTYHDLPHSFPGSTIACLIERLHIYPIEEVGVEFTHDDDDVNFILSHILEHVRLLASLICIAGSTRSTEAFETDGPVALSKFMRYLADSPDWSSRRIAPALRTLKVKGITKSSIVANAISQACQWRSDVKVVYLDSASS